MQNTATFNFKGELSGWLASGSEHEYCFKGNPSVKDAIEAIGIPHTEVAAIVINNVSAGFNYLLQNNDRVEVYSHGLYRPQQFLLADTAPLNSGFVADVHLGALARIMRLLGFDVLYNNNYTEADIIQIATTRKRIVLTRSTHLLKHKRIEWGCLIRSENSEVQTMQVIKRFNLLPVTNAFSRCMVCNGLLTVVDKQAVVDLLPPKTKQFFDEYWQCRHCKRIYWKGSHYNHMLQLIDKIQSAS